MSPVPFGSPAYEAGLERDDIVVSVGGRRLTGSDDWDAAVRQHKPGDAVEVMFQRRGKPVKATMRLREDPHIDVVPVEAAGGTLSGAQRTFRAAWLCSQRR